MVGSTNTSLSASDARISSRSVSRQLDAVARDRAREMAAPTVRVRTVADDAEARSACLAADVHQRAHQSTSASGRFFAFSRMTLTSARSIRRGAGCTRHASTSMPFARIAISFAREG